MQNTLRRPRLFKGHGPVGFPCAFASVSAGSAVALAFSTSFTLATRALARGTWWFSLTVAFGLTFTLALLATYKVSATHTTSNQPGITFGVVIV